MQLSNLSDQAEARGEFRANGHDHAPRDRIGPGRIDFDPGEVGLSDIRVGHQLEGGPGDVLRPFSAEVLDGDGPEPVVIGGVNGWIGWRINDADLADAGDRIDGLAYRLGVAAAEVVEGVEVTSGIEPVDSVVFIDHLEIETEYRGRRISRGLLGELLHVLRLDEESTLVMMDPAPGGWGESRLEPGPDRDAALANLTSALREQGFEPWDPQETGDAKAMWWLPIANAKN